MQLPTRSCWGVLCATVGILLTGWATGGAEAQSRGVMTYNGTASPSWDAARAVATDSQGNAVAVGTTIDAQSGPDFQVVKRDRSGTILWTRRLFGDLGFYEAGRAVAVDAQDNVVAVGYVRFQATQYDLAIGKWAPDGTLLWASSLTGDAELSSDIATAVAVDADGSVIVTGILQNKSTGDDIAVAKWSADGTYLWSRFLPNPGDDWVAAVAVDAEGNIAIAGDQTRSGSPRDGVVAKWDGEGHLLWFRVLNGYAKESFDYVSAVAFDSQGSVVTAGSIQKIGTESGFLVVKYDRDGNMSWADALGGTTIDPNNAALGLAVDSQDNVVAAGPVRNSDTGYDWLVAKWDPEGQRSWSDTLNGTLNGTDVAYAVAVDGGDDIVVAGSTRNVNTWGDLTVAKWRRDGVRLWVQRVDGTSQGVVPEVKEDFGRAVAVDSHNNIFVAGGTTNTGTDGDFTVVRFEQESLGTRRAQALLARALAERAVSMTRSTAALDTELGAVQAAFDRGEIDLCRRLLQSALGRVTERSRGRVAKRVMFQATPEAEALAQQLEREIRGLLERI